MCNLKPKQKLSPYELFVGASFATAAAIFWASIYFEYWVLSRRQCCLKIEAQAKSLLKMLATSKWTEPKSNEWKWHGKFCRQIHYQASDIVGFIFCLPSVFLNFMQISAKFMNHENTKWKIRRKNRVNSRNAFDDVIPIEELHLEFHFMFCG